MAVAVGKDIARENRDGQLSLKDALSFLPVVIANKPEAYNEWAIRWLVRYLEKPNISIDQAADVAAALAELPSEPSVLKALEDACR